MDLTRLSFKRRTEFSPSSYWTLLSAWLGPLLSGVVLIGALRNIGLPSGPEDWGVLSVFLAPVSKGSLPGLLLLWLYRVLLPHLPESLWMDHQESSDSVLLPEVDIHKSSAAFLGAFLFQYKAFGFWSPCRYQTPATTVNPHNICDFLDNCFYLCYIFW